MRRRQGCLEGLMELAFLTMIFDWLQDNFGFGRGASCTGIGCGVIMMIIFLLMACSICTGTNWLRAF